MTKIVHLRIRIRGDWTRVEQATRISRWIISGHGIYWIVFDANGKGNNHRRAAKRMPAAVNKLPSRRVIPHFQTRSNRWCVSGNFTEGNGGNGEAAGTERCLRD